MNHIISPWLNLSHNVPQIGALVSPMIYNQWAKSDFTIVPKYVQVQWTWGGRSIPPFICQHFFSAHCNCIHTLWLSKPICPYHCSSYSNSQVLLEMSMSRIELAREPKLKARAQFEQNQIGFFSSINRIEQKLSKEPSPNQAACFFSDKITNLTF